MRARTPVSRVLLLAALVSGAALLGRTVSSTAVARDRSEQTARKGGPRDLALERVLVRICSKGGCRGREGQMDASIEIWRDKRGKVGLLVYRGSYGACPHPPVNYYDAQGKLLLADGTGPREPEDWNSPELKKITAMQRRLQETDSRSCR